MKEINKKADVLLKNKKILYRNSSGLNDIIANSTLDNFKEVFYKDF